TFIGGLSLGGTRARGVLHGGGLCSGSGFSWEALSVDESRPVLAGVSQRCDGGVSALPCARGCRDALPRSVPSSGF
ncbi:MAG: hypothetical protein OXD43_01915, partial [Bacteroidetes bacterium]|nr:hypothetical protein [Bacteroidota bacterium]